MNPKRLFSSIVALAVGLGITSSAGAQETDKDYCNKVQARAHADAWLLFSPSLQVQALRYPATPTDSVVGGSTDSQGDQLRGAVLWSPLDFYRGTIMLSVADKDCLQHQVFAEATNLLEQMNDVGRGAALQAEVAYLDSHSGQIQEIVSNLQKVMAIGSLTVVDLVKAQQSADALERKFAVAKGQLAVLHARDYVPIVHSSSEIAAKLQQYSMEFEKETSRGRMLDPWQVQASFGAVPPMANGDSVSWYGQISLQYNFGGLTRAHYENQYLTARQHELQYARYELSDQIRRLQDGIRAGIRDADMEIATLDRRIAELVSTDKNLAAHPDAPDVASIKAIVDLQIMDAESDRLYLIELRNQLTKWK
jgi:hypothetical protein